MVCLSLMPLFMISLSFGTNNLLSDHHYCFTTWLDDTKICVRNVKKSYFISYFFLVCILLFIIFLWISQDDKWDRTKAICLFHTGVTVLVTHLERKPLDPFFRGLLLKQFYVDKEGNKIVKVGDMAFNYHPNFCLYLSTTVPLFIKGEIIHIYRSSHSYIYVYGHLACKLAAAHALLKRVFFFIFIELSIFNVLPFLYK